MNDDAPSNLFPKSVDLRQVRIQPPLDAEVAVVLADLAMVGTPPRAADIGTADRSINLIERQARRIAELERENAQWRTWGIIEVAIHNPSVDSSMRHWVDRATAAESALALAQARVDALAYVIEWALGEHEEFPDWPATVEMRGNPKFWWRKELRERFIAARATGGEG